MNHIAWSGLIPKGNNSGGLSLSIQTLNQNIPAWDTQVFGTIPANSLLNVYADLPIPWPLLTPIGTIDPDGNSSLWPNLINGNLGDLCYNNLSPGSANKSLPAIDLWSSLPVSKVNLYRWDAAYLSNDFRIEGSNDGTSWTTVASWLSSSGVGLQEIPVIWTFRYWRLFNVSGVNSAFVVLTEMELFSVSPGTNKTLVSSNSDFVTVIDDGGDLEITNNQVVALDFTVNYLS